MINKNILDDLHDLDSGMEQQDKIQNIQDKIQNNEMVNMIGCSRLLTVNKQTFLKFMQTITLKVDNKIMKIQQKQQLNSMSMFASASISASTSILSRQQISLEIGKCNAYCADISREVLAIQKYVKQIYSKKIPQLQSIVNQQLFYCRALLDIQNNNHNTHNSKEPFYYLTPHQRISLRICISAHRDPLNYQQQISLISAANTVMQLQSYREILMIYLETCIQIVAPNLCQLLGTEITSKLVSTAGGIDKLAAMPACNIQVMGGSRSAQIGFSQLQRNHTGVFGQMDIVRDAPKKFQMKLVRMRATNTAKCARVDLLGSSFDQGAKLRQQMYERFQKVQEQGGLMRIDKPLEIPDMQPKKKRGGKRHRKNKQLYEMSEVRKNQNRLKFGEEGQQQIEEGVGLGMLKSGTGKLKVQIKKQKLKVSKKMQQRANKKSGLESSLNLTGVQGIQLINPSLRNQAQFGTSSNYFAKESGFRTILNNKMK